MRGLGSELAVCAESIGQLAELAGTLPALGEDFSLLRTQVEAAIAENRRNLAEVQRGFRCIQALLERQQSNMLESVSLLAGKIEALSSEGLAALRAGLSRQDARQMALFGRLDGVQQSVESLTASVDVRFAAMDKRFKPTVFQAGGEILATEADGFIVGVPGDEWRMAAYLAFRGPLEPGLVRRFLEVVQPGMTVVDVGANFGAYTLYGARAVGPAGKVYAFEPAPRTFKILEDNVQVNGFAESGIVELHQAAVLDRSGLAELTVYAGNSGHNTLFGNAETGSSTQVATVSLDEKIINSRVDVVKIDAEGAEPFVFRGMKRILSENPKLIIFMEFAAGHLSRAGVDPAAFLEEIRSAGLEFRLVDDRDGSLRAVTPDDLLGGFSPILQLARAGSMAARP